jgi:predicted ABC-type ATPase
MARRPELTQAEANAAAWAAGRALFERAIRERLDFAFETTLGGTTMTRLLLQAAESGIDVLVWYVGLASPEQHFQRVAARVRRGGHPIPEEAIRRRWDYSRLNLVRLLSRLRELRLFDNSDDVDPAAGQVPTPRLLLHMKDGGIVGPPDLSETPDWAKPIVAAAIQHCRI